MKKTAKHNSVTQKYIDISDTLAAGRSAIVFLYIIIGIALVVSCLMYIVFDIVPVKGSYSMGDGETVSCIICVRGYELKKGDLVVLRGKRNAAVVVETAGVSDMDQYKDMDYPEDSLLVNIDEVNGSKELSAVQPDELEGKICYVVSPMKRFGTDIHKLFG